jgi:DNA-binding response OmpR family regulator
MVRILVVDDDSEICTVLGDFLTVKGFAAYTALDGRTAMTKIKEIRPHIVLLDIMMPGMGGIEVLKRIKEVDPAVAVIMVTGIYDEELAKRAIALGADEYVTKPIDFDHLEIALTIKIIDLLA